MGKVTKTIPEGSPYNPNLNSNIGDISEIDDVSYGDTTVDRDFEVENVNIEQIKDVLNESTYSTEELSESNNINEYALFRPDFEKPYSLSEFAGYNHNAKPPTNFANKTDSISRTIQTGSGTSDDPQYYVEVDILLNRGERPPSMDSNFKTWDSVTAVVEGGERKTDTAEVTGPSVSDGTPNHRVKYPVESNDPAEFSVSVKAYYDQNDEYEIEDTHPDITIKAEPQYKSYDVNTDDMSKYSGVRHIYSYGSEDNKIISGDNNELWVNIVSENVSKPDIALYTQDFQDSIPSSVENDDGFTVYYTATEGMLNDGTWVSAGNDYESGSGNLEVGDTFKRDGTWYKVNSIESGYKATRL